jgi:hypothetical protein
LSRSWEFFLKGWYANGKLAGTLFQSIIILDGKIRNIPELMIPEESVRSSNYTG